jgi:hypothetical protein
VQPLLAIYLQDHHAAGLAGARLARRVSTADANRRSDLQRVASEITQDLGALEGIMRDLGVEPHRAKDTFARIGERLGRLKLNGRVLRRSPLSDLLELEALRVGITGKRALWVSLAASSNGPTDVLERLVERAESQIRVVEDARVQAARRAFARAEHQD